MKKVLVACEESQTVCQAFLEKGFDAYSCDLQKPSGTRPDRHLQMDAIEAIKRTSWDLIIAHPPCTYLSCAGARWFDESRLSKGKEASAFFNLLLNADAPHVCVENPRPLKVFNLPSHTQHIEPWMFGDPYTKRTYLWLRNLPRLRSTKVVPPVGNWTELHTSAKIRSKTFPGIAAAMADQWGEYILKNG